MTASRLAPRLALLLATAGGCVGCATASGAPAASQAPPSALPTDIAVAVQPFAAAAGGAASAIASAQAQERAATDVTALRAAAAAELGAVNGLDTALQHVPFPPDLRADEVTHLQLALQQAETWLQAAAGASSVGAAQSDLAVARQAEARAQLSETLIARFMGINPPPTP